MSAVAELSAALEQHIRSVRLLGWQRGAAPDHAAYELVRKFLSGIERVAMVCAEDGEKDGPSIAARFLEEMDWNAPALTIQLERCEPVFRALAIIQQRHQKVA